jgi:hypothetical protein
MGTAADVGGGGGCVAGECVVDGTQQQQTRKPATHLLQLKLGPATDVSIGVEGGDDALSNRGGVHGWQLSKPMLASRRLEGNAREVGGGLN